MSVDKMRAIVQRIRLILSSNRERGEKFSNTLLEDKNLIA